ncbi:MAG: imelysin family protein [Bacteroidota bacterium]
MRPRLVLLILPLALVLGFAACDADSDDPDNRTAVRQQLLADIATRIIEPGHDAFAADAAALAEAVTAFERDPSPATLGPAQAVWTTAARSWQRLSALNLPGAVRNGLFHNRISTWPANTAFIEDAVDTEDPIDEAYAARRGSNARGLPALEYLLFAGGDAAVLGQMSDPQRRAYTLAVAQDLLTQAGRLAEAWSRGGGNELGMFEDADTEGRNLQSSVSRVVNEMAMIAEDLRYVKVGRPLGIARDPDEPDGAPQPDRVQAPNAQVSAELFRDDLAGLRALVTGGGGTGFDDYLVTLDAEVDGRPFGEVLLAQIDATDAAMAALGMPLHDAVTDNPDAARAVYDETISLLRVIKVDFAGWLGVSITFSDNDGDSG